MLRYIALISLVACACDGKLDANELDEQAVQRQQAQYVTAQPVPAFDWSLERHIVIQLYELRNQKVATHSVWRSDMGTIEGDCPSMGFGIPYDTSLTNPLVMETGYSGAAAAVEQPEPNGIFLSKNTSATWVLCTGPAGSLEPVYVESKVTVYPGTVKVDYETNRVIRGAASTNIKVGK